MEAEQLAGGVAAAASDRLEALGELLTERLPSAVKGAAASLRDKLSSASEELPKALREAPRATLLPDTLIATALTLALLGFALQSRAACSFQAAGAPGGGLLLCRQTMAGHAEVQTALARVTQRSGWLWRRRQVCAALTTLSALFLAICPLHANQLCTRTRRWTTLCCWAVAGPTPCCGAPTSASWPKPSRERWRRLEGWN